MPPLYTWSCPKCNKITSVIQRVADHAVPPEKCDPNPERTGQKNPEGKPVYLKHDPCGHTGPDGWKRDFSGHGNFILTGGGWSNSGYEKW